MPPRRSAPLTYLSAFLLMLLIGTVPAQAQQGRAIDRLEAEPAALVLEAGQTATVEVAAYDASGEPVEAAFRYRAPRAALEVSEGRVTARTAGRYELVVSLFPGPEVTWTGERPPAVTVPVQVDWPPVAQIELEAEPYRLYAGTSLDHRARALHADGTERPDAEFRWQTSHPEIARVDRYGRVTALRPGTAVLTAAAEGVEEELSYEVEPFPAEALELAGGREEARTGDVLRFEARALGNGGEEVEDLKVSWFYEFEPASEPAARGAAAEVVGGRFVAEEPGLYTVYARSGPLVESRRVEVRPREVVRPIERVGHGRIDHTRTTDFWVYEAADGRDYALSGSKDVGGQAYVWDVTDPANLILTDSVKVDARSVNDVKVSPDGRYAVMTREGASDRRNGVVLLDLSEPAHPRVATSYTEGLTGGVHNTWPENDYLFALSAGEKFVILDVTDLERPRYVGEYNHPGSRIHDLILHDGLIFSAEWNTGIVVVDVGNGMAGGTLEEPRFVTSYALPGGNTHDVIPYEQTSTGKFYIIAGDEVMSRRGKALSGPKGAYRARYDPETGEGGIPPSTDGYIHVVDFTDIERPEKVARYYVEEYGAHNIWVEDDILYQAHYEGGLRVVDLSGELRGDLKAQGREMAVFKPFDPAGYVANAPMVWSAMPHKGHIFLSDTNSGLWTVRMGPPAAE